MRFHFTFGQAHTHPKTDEPMRDYWVTVETIDWGTARHIFVTHYGLKWSHQYTEENFNPIWFPGGCYEVLDTPAPEPESVNIETPEGGEPIYLLHLTYKNDVVGFVKCKSLTELNEFKEYYAGLTVKGWGSILLSFDAGKPE